MSHDEIVELIRPAVTGDRRIWADLGAGSGNFCFALDTILGYDGTIFAVDHRLDILKERVSAGFLRSQIHFLESEISDAIQLLPLLDGILMANTLHYVRDPQPFLEKVLSLLKKGGAFLLVEYDREDANPYVPYPISMASWQRLALKSGLSLPEEVGRVKSIYQQREIYAAVSEMQRGD